MGRVFLVVMDSVGIGGARDAFGAEICTAAVEAGGPPFAWVSVEYRLAPERASRAEDTN